MWGVMAQIGVSFHENLPHCFLSMNQEGESCLGLRIWEGAVTFLQMTFIMSGDVFGGPAREGGIANGTSS